MDFNINLLPDDEEAIEGSRKRLIIDTGNFVLKSVLKKDITSKKPIKVDNKSYWLANDLLLGRFWSVLEAIDGPTERALNLDWFYQEDTELGLMPRRREAREWARGNFKDIELKGLLHLTVNQALLTPYGTDILGWPGILKGHSILYEHLVRKEDSMFRGALPYGFEERLNNGRFWEELPDAQARLNNGRSIGVLNDVLRKNYDSLDVDFAIERGIPLMTRNQGIRVGVMELGFQYLHPLALKRYGEFLQGLDEHPETPAGVVEELAHQYIGGVLAFDERTESLYHQEYEEDDTPRGDFRKLLKAPIAQKYLRESGEIREHVAERLRWVDHFDPRLVDEVVAQVPYKGTIRKLIRGTKETV